MDPTTDWANADDWELINDDDGFVYKRKKQRRREDSGATSSDANQPPNPEEEGINLRKRKKSVLLKLREKYMKEIQQWERLSNALKAMEANSQTQFQDCEGIYNTVSPVEPSISEEHRRLVDDLLYQVETQEAIIRGVSNLCDVAGALCSAQEERSKQQILDLPIWELTPYQLMAGLADQ